MFIQLLGFCGFCFTVMTFQQNSHRRIIILQLLGSTFFTLHFYLLGSYTGSILNMIGLARSIVFFFKRYKWASSNWWIVFFSALCIPAGIYTWEGPLSLLPIAGTMICGIAFGIDNPKLTRRLYATASPLWLLYDIASFSWGGTLTEIFNLLSVIIGMLRFDRTRRQDSRIADKQG